MRNVGQALATSRGVPVYGDCNRARIREVAGSSLLIDVVALVVALVLRLGLVLVVALGIRLGLVLVVVLGFGVLIPSALVLLLAHVALKATLFVGNGVLGAAQQFGQNETGEFLELFDTPPLEIGQLLLVTIRGREVDLGWLALELVAFPSHLAVLVNHGHLALAVVGLDRHDVLVPRAGLGLFVDRH